MKVFPDWFSKNAQTYWTEALTNWSRSGVDFSGIWLDMNECSSFCEGSCGSDADLSNTTVPFLLPGEPGNPVTDYPEGWVRAFFPESHILTAKFFRYNATVSGPSGNITVDGVPTFGAGSSSSTLSKRGLGAGDQDGVQINMPPYAIHNGESLRYLRSRQICVDTTTRLRRSIYAYNCDQCYTRGWAGGTRRSQSLGSHGREDDPSSAVTAPAQEKTFPDQPLNVRQFRKVDGPLARGQLQQVAVYVLQHPGSLAIPVVPDSVRRCGYVRFQ